MENTRFLCSDEVDLLLNLSLSAENNWEILIATSDETFFSDIRKLFLDDERVRIEKVRFGSDALILCAKKLPDLLILDGKLPDIPCEELIKCIKRNEDLKHIKILCRYIEENTINLFELGANDYFQKYDLDKIQLANKINSLLYSSETRPDTGHKEPYERRWPRTKLNITANIETLNLKNPSQCDHGTGFVDNISRGGALISRIKLNNNKLKPNEAFNIRLKIDKPPLKDWKADSVIVRFTTDNSAGVKFVDMSKQNQLKIAGLFHA